MVEAPTEPTSDGQRRPASAAGAADLGLRFLLEVAALAALAYWGFHTGTSLAGDLALGLGTPPGAAIVWGLWAAPKSGRRLSGWRLIAVQLAVLGAGAVALVAAGQPVLGAVFGALVVVNALRLRTGDRQ